MTPQQCQEVERLVEQMKQLRTVVRTILALADELAKGTIEKVLAKSDGELALEYLLGSFSDKE